MRPDSMTKLSSLMYCSFLWRVRDFTASGLGTKRLYLVSVASDYTHSTRLQVQSAFFSYYVVLNWTIYILLLRTVHLNYNIYRRRFLRRHHPPLRAVLSQMCCSGSVRWCCFRSCYQCNNNSAVCVCVPIKALKWQSIYTENYCQIQRPTEFLGFI